MHAKQRRHRRVPDDAVVVAIGFGVGLRAAVFLLPVAPFDLVHQILIVRMHHQRQAGVADGFEAFEQFAVIVDADAGHMRIVAAGVFDHEDFERQRSFFGQPRNFLRHRAGGIVVEVDDGVLAVMFDQRAVTLHRGRRRIDVGHADGRGHAAGGRGHGRGGDVFFVGETGIAMMGVRIDQAGNDFLALGIDHLVGRVRQHRRFAERDDLAVVHRDIGVDETARRPHFAIFNQQIQLSHEFKFSLRRLCEIFYMIGA